MKVLKYGIVAMTSLFLVSGCGNSEVDTITNELDNQKVTATTKVPKVTKPIKIKGGNKISIKDIETYEKNHSGKNLTRRYVLGRILDEKYPMTEKEVSKDVEKFKKELSINYETYLTENNYTKDTIGDEVKYMNQVHQLGLDSLGITDKMLEEYYDSWVPSMMIQHIMVNDEATINEVKQKLDAGSDFTTLVSEYSIDEQTKNKEGKWSDLKKGDLISSLEIPVFQLQKGEVSAPINTIMGWHIVKLLEPAEKKPYKEIKAQLKEDYISTNLSTVYLEEVLDKLLKNEVKPLDSNLKIILGIS